MTLDVTMPLDVTLDFSISSSASVEVVYIGSEQQPVIVVDNLLQHPDDVIEYANSGAAFQKNPQDFYPGVRKLFTGNYSANVREYIETILRTTFDIRNTKAIVVASTVLSLTTTLPRELRPIQSVPHIDNVDPDTFAMVHYLCQPRHGGTAFYRHRQTGYESINEQRLPVYAPALKKEVMDLGLTTFNYTTGDTSLFECTAAFESRFNRAIFYRSNILHSGNVQVASLSNNPDTGRLTANMLIRAVDV